MAYIINTDKTTATVTPANGTDFSLDELNAIVDGYIEIHHLNNNQIMVVNEEGKLNGLPLNTRATRLVREAGINDYIVGRVLVCDTKQVK